jgi:hypothetical protein
MPLEALRWLVSIDSIKPKGTIRVEARSLHDELILDAIEETSPIPNLRIPA